MHSLVNAPPDRRDNATDIPKGLFDLIFKFQVQEEYTVFHCFLFDLSETLPDFPMI